MKKILLGMVLAASLLMAKEVTAYDIDDAATLHCTYTSLKLAGEGKKWVELSSKDKIRHDYDVKENGNIIDTGKLTFKYDHSDEGMMIYFSTTNDTRF